MGVWYDIQPLLNRPHPLSHPKPQPALFAFVAAMCAYSLEGVADLQRKSGRQHHTEEWTTADAAMAVQWRRVEKKLLAYMHILEMSFAISQKFI